MATEPLTAEEIRNRIIEVRKVRFGDVAPHPRNPKRHPDIQREAFRGAVREIGFASVPVAYVNGEGVLTWADGHLRGSEVADYVGEVAILDITDAEAELLLVTADPIAHLAQTDAAALQSLLMDVNTGEAALQEMLAKMAEEAGLYLDGASGGGAVDGGQDAGEARKSLAERFGIPPFSILDARQGYWQDRKRAWIALGIQSELGRGENLGGMSESSDEYRSDKNAYRERANRVSPGGSPRPAMRLGADGRTVRGDGAGRPLRGSDG